MKIFSVKLYSQVLFFSDPRTKRAWNPEESKLITSISQNGFPEINQFIEECSQHFRNKTLYCRYISSLFASNFQCTLHCGMYNPSGWNTFSPHAWVTFNGLEFDLRAMYENYVGLPTTFYNKIQRYKETNKDNLIFDNMRDRDRYQVFVKDERKVKYYK